MENLKEHIVMLPFMAHGHLIPYTALARQLQQRNGFTITIANTPLNIQYLRSTIHSSKPELTTNPIRLVELPFCSTDHGLHLNAENTENLSLDQIFLLMHASLTLKAPFCQLLLDISAEDGRPPICIADVFFGWSTGVAKSVGSLHFTFSTCGAYGILAYISSWLNFPHRAFDSLEFCVPGFPDECVFHVTHLHPFIRNADRNWSRFMQTQISLSLESRGWLLNTNELIEPKAVQWFREYIKLPIWPVGPLLPAKLLQDDPIVSCSDISVHRSGKISGIPMNECLFWLDKQNPGSVLYISFGSQNSISPSQMMALANGLEDSGCPFIWVIRPPIGFDRRSDFKSEWLPIGFEQRVRKGLLVLNWAPQLEILKHKSTGAFLSHCGWNSVTESLSQGVPIIGWPMAGEQSFNSKMLAEEMGVGVELTRGVNTDITGEEVKKVMELVMKNNSAKGIDMKSKAMEIRGHIRAALRDNGEEKGCSLESLDDFISTIMHGRD